MSKCNWSLSDDFTEADYNIYDSECGEKFQILEGTPSENKIKYCPFCGKEIIEEK